MNVHAYKRVDIDSLKPWENNPRTHSADQIKQIRRSIREFGFTNPLLIDESGLVIAGHGRVEAAKREGLTELPAIELQGLSEAQKRALVIADNQIATNAGWDENLLRLELDTLKDDEFDLSIVGFTDEELAKLLADPLEEGLTDPDEMPEPLVDAVTALGDVWVLGKHRLMCGDSTSIDAVEKLLAGEKPDMVFTDPPYNIDYQGLSGNHEKIKNDKMSDDEFLDFLRQSIVPCDVLYVCCSWQYAHLFKQAMTDIGCPAKAMIVWDKVNPAQHLDLYFKQHEIIFYHGPFGGNRTVRGDVWQLKRQQNTVHPTMKPVELIVMALKDHPKRNVVFDAFGGSGSTMIACEKTGKTARLMELDPKYCDVIVQRWQDFTGKQATLESEGRTFDEIAGERHGQ